MSRLADTTSNEAGEVRVPLEILERLFIDGAGSALDVLIRTIRSTLHIAVREASVVKPILRGCTFPNSKRHYFIQDIHLGRGAGAMEVGGTGYPDQPPITTRGRGALVLRKVHPEG